MPSNIDTFARIEDYYGDGEVMKDENGRVMMMKDGHTPIRDWFPAIIRAQLQSSDQKLANDPRFAGAATVFNQYKGFSLYFEPTVYSFSNPIHLV